MMTLEIYGDGFTLAQTKSIVLETVTEFEGTVTIREEWEDTTDTCAGVLVDVQVDLPRAFRKELRECGVTVFQMQVAV